MAALTQAEKRVVADELIGTCSSGQSLADRYSVDTLEIVAAAEECEVSRCRQCDWWVETHEVNEDGICGDCYGD